MILVDSSAFYALADRNDTNHATACGCYAELVGSATLLTTAAIALESWMLMKARLGREPADAFWRAVAGNSYELAPVDAVLLAEAKAIDEAYADAGFGLVDAVSLAVCERLKVAEVFTFDRRHFSIYRPGFTGSLSLLP